MKWDGEIIERGTGEPMVIVPGIQGRWEYSRGLVEACAQRYRVLTFALRDDRVGRSGGLASPTIDLFADQVAQVLDRARIDRAVVTGVSFGGLVALRFAATRQERVRALVMISAPGPRWHLRPRHEVYARVPWLFGPVFLAEAPWRLRQEVLAALPDWPSRRHYLHAQLHTLVTAPPSLSRMAARSRLIASYDRVADSEAVAAPALIIQGDEALDHVTGAGGTAEYATLIRNARLAVLERTGHLGSVTRPARCAELMHRFLIDVNKDTHHSAA